MVTTKHTEFNGTQLLQQLIEKRSLTEAQAEALMDGWLTESLSAILSSAILIAIQSKGVTGEVHHVDCGYHTVGMMAVDAADDLAEMLQGIADKGSS